MPSTPTPWKSGWFCLHQVCGNPSSLHNRRPTLVPGFLNRVPQVSTLCQLFKEMGIFKDLTLALLCYSVKSPAIKGEGAEGGK